MAIPIHQVDAFTDRPFAGNPAAVCVLDAARPDRWMQQVAAEMNLSETAFVIAAAGRRGLRWFTPAVEVDLCGHATLAAAHVLFETGAADAAAAIEFDTRSGRLCARRADGGIALDFPALPPQPTALPPGLAEALGRPPIRWVGRSRFDVLVELADAAAVRALRPDFAALRAVDARGVIATAAADRPDHDFVSRFFAPAVGVDEDPVTGSAHCVLAPHWSERLGGGELRGWQASARGGGVRVRLRGDRVDLIGGAVTVLRGELLG